ncbi:MAG: hypothetical protein H0U49_10215 [Parachlamydiaceae bacterium]|nr:hypothetical protein [Parachlamydiaceae bacterium]
MESIIHAIFFNNWQRKLTALLTAIIIWFFVNHSITETKTIRNVPIRISNLPSDKTIIGLLPNGILSKRIALTLTGSKEVIDEIEPGDLEVNIDASAIDRTDWIFHITKKNLVSLNPTLDLIDNIADVDYAEFVIKLNRLVTEKIPLEILNPIGTAPPGYEFLGLWPHRLVQTVIGPEEEVYRLRNQGLTLTFNLNEISKSDLDAIKSQQLGGNNNEISFLVPVKWKQVSIPFRNNVTEEINDAEAAYLRLDFLRQELLPIGQPIPIRIFYPVQSLETLNPQTISLENSGPVVAKNGLSLFSKPLYIKNVSRLFLEVVRDFLEIQIAVVPQEGKERLPWGLEVVTPHQLEETFVAFQLAAGNKQTSTTLKKRESLYRKRFREYFQRLAFYISQDHKLDIESSIKGDKIIITEY